MTTITWNDLLSCFSPDCRLSPHEFLRTTFEADWLREVVDRAAGEGVVSVPAGWQTSGYPDETERFRYARHIAGELFKLGVTVTDVPPPDRLRERYYHGREY